MQGQNPDYCSTPPGRVLTRWNLGSARDYLIRGLEFPNANDCKIVAFNTVPSKSHYIRAYIQKSYLTACDERRQCDSIRQDHTLLAKVRTPEFDTPHHDARLFS